MGIKSDSLSKRRLPFRPTLLADETLYSWCCRYHQLSGNEHAADTSIQLFGSKTAGLMHDFPGRLAIFVERTENELGNASNLAYLHTLLGFYASFLSAALSEEFVRDMEKGSVTRLKFRLGLPSSRLGAGHPLKACQACMESDKASAEIAYWHMAHQMPGRWLCPKHTLPLWVSSIKTRLADRLQWILPSDVKTDQWRSPVPICSDITLPLERIGHLIDNFRADPNFHLNRNTLYHTYLTGLKRNGWLTKCGFIRMAVVRDEFSKYARGLNGISDFPFVDSAYREDGGFLGGLLRRPRHRDHPTKHLVLISFLFDNWPDFLQTYQSNSINPTLSKKVESRRIPDPRANLKSLFLQLLSSEDISITRAARRVGLSTGTAIALAQQNNIQYTRRPRIMYPEVIQKISELLLEGNNRDDVARSNGVSRQAVDRLLSSHPELKKEWARKTCLRKREDYRARFLQTVGNYPELSIKAIRSIPGNGFQWLYRHDSEWLSTKLPAFKKKF